MTACMWGRQHSQVARGRPRRVALGEPGELRLRSCPSVAQHLSNICPPVASGAEVWANSGQLVPCFRSAFDQTWPRSDQTFPTLAALGETLTNSHQSSPGWPNSPKFIRDWPDFGHSCSTLAPSGHHGQHLAHISAPETTSIWARLGQPSDTCGARWVHRG